MEIRNLKVLRNKKIYIYGAGQIGCHICEILQQLGIAPAAFLVTDGTGNDAERDGIAVREIDSYAEQANDCILVSVGARYVPEVEHTLREKRIKNYKVVDSSFAAGLYRDYFEEVFLRTSGKYYRDISYTVEQNYYPLALCRDESVYHWRVLMDEHSADETFRKYVREHDILREFEKNYGIMHYLPEVSDTENVACKVQILKACCHLDKKTDMKTEEPYIVPIQVGKALTNERICELTDDTGENISMQNSNYCECTALYWAWKNQWGKTLDYIGLCHYRRKFGLNKRQMEQIKKQRIDIILTAPTMIADLRKHFTYSTKNEEDWDILKEAIRVRQPKYLQTFEVYEQQHFICQCNMFIMRRDIFDDYAAFLFDVLGYIEAYWNKERPGRHDRYLGYMAENLLSVYVMKNKDCFKVAYADMLVSVGEGK